MSHQNETVEFGSAYEKYFYLHYDKDGVFLYPEEKTTVTEREISLCGYFVIITSERYLVSSIEEHTKIVFAKHQNDAGMLGAFYHFCSLH